MTSDVLRKILDILDRLPTYGDVTIKGKRDALLLKGEVVALLNAELDHSIAESA